MNRKPLSKKALTALETLTTMQPFVITPERQVRSRDTRNFYTIPAHIETGINSKILDNLQAAGVIS